MANMANISNSNIINQWQYSIEKKEMKKQLLKYGMA